MFAAFEFSTEGMTLQKFHFIGEKGVKLRRFLGSRISLRENFGR